MLLLGPGLAVLMALALASEPTIVGALWVEIVEQLFGAKRRKKP